MQKKKLEIGGWRLEIGDWRLEIGFPKSSFGCDILSYHDANNGCRIHNRQNEIARLDEQLTRHFQTALAHAPFLTRSLVSFQANKTRPFYRWYKYKEAFSATLKEQPL